MPVSLYRQKAVSQLSECFEQEREEYILAYTMIHILIAEKVLEYMKTPVEYSTYLLGTIAPDAVHAAKDYSPAQKERSHLFAEGARWGRVTSEEDLARWSESIKAFYLKERDRYDKDFFLGYIVHLLVDRYSCQNIYVPFYLSIKDDHDEMMAQYRKECSCVNYYLYREYSKEKNLYNILRAGHSCSIDGVFEKDLLDPRIDQLFSYEFQCHDIEHLAENRICTLDNTAWLIQETPAIIKKVLLEDSGL